MPVLIAPLVLALLLANAGLCAAQTLLVGNKSAASVSLIDIPSGRAVATAKTRPGPHEIAVSGDGALAVVTNYGTGDAPGNSLSIIEVERGETVGTVDLGEHTRPHGIVFMPGNRKVLVTAEGSGNLLEVDVWAGKVVAAVPTGQRVSHMLAYDPEGRRAYVANIASGSVSLLSMGSRSLLAYRASGQGAEGIALSPDRRWLWVTNRAEDSLSLFDARYLDKLATLPVPGFPIRAEALPDGRVLVTSARSAQLTVIDPEGPAVLETVDIALAGETPTLFGDAFAGSSVPIGIELAPDRRRVWIAHAAADAVQELEVDSWRELRVLKTGDEPDAMAYSPRSVKKR
ncbi:MAG: beta-propeller fold lactonase family protein [Halieaceae bacterium]|jgi:DNA-binding beta-propeller fold protein YncE|nr:beta-propeller fold lactonase family protein [Halieaceae bacterium]